MDDTLFYSLAKFSSTDSQAITAEGMTPSEVRVRSQRRNLKVNAPGGCENFVPQSLMLLPAKQMVLPFTLPVSLPLSFKD